MQRDPLIVGNIVGDIVDYFDASARLRVFYSNREITVGSELRPSHVVNQPTVQITGLSGSLYALVMVDPDAPTPGDHTAREYLHWYAITAWLVTDIPEGGDVSRGTEVVSYESPRPTAGIHRFAFVAFRQTVRQAIYAPGWRANFNTRDLAAFYNLGEPAAAAYFNCQREGSCGGRRWY